MLFLASCTKPVYRVDSANAQKEWRRDLPSQVSAESALSVVWLSEGNNYGALLVVFLMYSCKTQLFLGVTCALSTPKASFGSNFGRSNMNPTFVRRAPKQLTFIVSDNFCTKWCTADRSIRQQSTSCHRTVRQKSVSCIAWRCAQSIPPL